ncbi:unnamed protein product [Linum tenue]|uniref:TIR domain-containing protein n=1 Tax=Linum tenue TaxID=586396 RepID=A0AAV0IG70_9ROSI|nr:unnamed protein product [Linum tenue]
MSQDSPPQPPPPPPPPRGRLLVNPLTRTFDPPPPPRANLISNKEETVVPTPDPSPPAAAPPPPDNENTNPSCKYDAFISFRGTDVRQTFLSHLFAHMNDERHVLTFKDDVNLKRGDKISPTLIDAIERSSSYVVIFSPNYADSDWCLDELVKILECSRKYERKVVPVFYGGVTPSHVRNRKGSYGDAFTEYEKKLPSKEMEAKLKTWTAALKQAANISGFDSLVTKPERHLVEEITRTILGAIRQTFSPIMEGLVGIDQDIQDVEKLLSFDDENDNRVIGFWGMPGIGKTTLAKAMFHKIDAEKFEGVHFIENFAAQLKKTQVIDLQNELFHKLLGDDEQAHVMPTNLKLDRVGRVRSFVVVDDVTMDSLRSLKELLHGKLCNLFRAGSRIILTSTDRQVLKNVGCQVVHQVKGLDDDKALQLLSSYAFRKDRPPSEFMERCKKIVSYASGHPLALTVLGAALLGRSTGYWDCALDKLKKIPNKEIENLLMISYDGLSVEEQSVFLDIACFFNHEDYNFVTRVLDEDLVSNLVDKSLLCVNGSKGEIEMHGMLKDLGKKIVRKERMLEKRSRLWKAEDLQTLLNKNMGTGATEGILLNMSKTKEEVCASSATFERMMNLRLLSIQVAKQRSVISAHVLPLSSQSKKVFVPEELKSLSGELRLLEWDLFPATSLPCEFSPRYLHVLRLKHSNIRQLWESNNVDLGNLRELNLFASKYLRKLPDLSKSKKLEVIDLTSCTSLDELHDSIIYLPKLQTLILNSCGSLNPNFLDQHQAKGDQTQAFPSLKEVNLDKTRIKQVPYLIKSAPLLSKLSCSSCPNIPEFPEILQSMEGLLELDLSYCKGISSIPDTIRILSSLEKLDLSGTGIEEVPSSVLDLRRLSVLRYAKCEKLLRAPTSYKKLYCLKTLDDSDCVMLTNKNPELPDTLEYQRDN